MLKSFRARWLSVFLGLLGCNNGIDEGTSTRLGAGGESGGVNASAGTPGGSITGDASANAGTGGGSGRVGIGAIPSSSGGAGTGMTGSGGRATNSAGAGGSGTSGGSVTGGAVGNGGSGGSGRGPAPTFTMIYNTIITPNCGGTRCHLKRQAPFGYDFSTKSAASASWRSDVIPGDAEGSPMFQVLNFAIMPKDKPPLSIEQLYLVYDWINAGALDN